MLNFNQIVDGRPSIWKWCDTLWHTTADHSPALSGICAYYRQFDWPQHSIRDKLSQHCRQKTSIWNGDKGKTNSLQPSLICLSSANTRNVCVALRCPSPCMSVKLSSALQKLDWKFHHSTSSLADLNNTPMKFLNLCSCHLKLEVAHPFVTFFACTGPSPPPSRRFRCRCSC